jgi:KDO2-lipid IV(A) lauroyltransferase
LIGYRKKVVLENLRNSFPEKSEEEIRFLCKQFYRYFCDLLLEILKTLTISSKTVNNRISFDDVTVFKKYYDKGQSVIIVTGHQGNWELGGARFSTEPIHRLYVIYHPLANKYFDKLVYHMRTRLGNKLYAMNETLRGMLRDRDKITATAFISDQTPFPENAYWTTFLNQDTPVFNGPAKIARKLNYPVIYISLERPRRGYYKLRAEALIENPASLSEDEISELHTRRLERDIIAQPEIWLWTHRRWKHKRHPSTSLRVT